MSFKMMGRTVSDQISLAWNRHGHVTVYRLGGTDRMGEYYETDNRTQAAAGIPPLWRKLSQVR